MSRLRYKLTDTFARKVRANPPASGQQLFYDDEVRGFGLRITSTGSMSYVAEASVDGKTRRVTIGPANLFTAEKARKYAMGRLLAMKVEGRDLTQEGREAKEAKSVESKDAITFRGALEQRLAAKKKLRDGTRDKYWYLANNYLNDWLERPLKSITREEVLSRHAQLSVDTPSLADSSMKMLSTAFVFVRETLELVIRNPVTVLYTSEAWNGSEPRATRIADARLPTLWAELGRISRDDASTDKQRTFADLVRVALLTGLRRNEAAKLRWSDVYLDESRMVVPQTKKRLNVELPLPPFVVTMLEARQQSAASVYIFPSGTARSRFGWITGIQDLVEDLRAACGTGFERFSLHDLRATYASLAEGEGIGQRTVQSLLDHQPADTLGRVYVRPRIENLIGPSKQIESAILCRCGE